jgi:ribosomal protein S6
MKYYELTYLTMQDMSEEAAKQLSDKFAASIVAKLGVVIDTAKAYKKRLAYPVKKQEVAFVNSLRFQIEPQPLLALNDEVKKDALILRSLIVSYVPQPIRRVVPRPVAEIEQQPSEKIQELQAEAKPETKEEEKKAPEKPRVRRDKPKADLKEIGEKLDEILND